MAGHLDTRYKLTVKPRDPVKIDGQNSCTICLVDCTLRQPVNSAVFLNICKFKSINCKNLYKRLISKHILEYHAFL